MPKKRKKPAETQKQNRTWHLRGPIVHNDPIAGRGESPHPDYHPELYAEDQ